MAADVTAFIVVPVLASIILVALAVSIVVVYLLKKKLKGKVESVCVFNLLLCMCGFTHAYHVTASKMIVDKVL